ncbi:MAG: DUF4831 family protein [Prevotellaceae bacterium]|nr:DUF4831 family protein [Prevotellaceae bacterium]
MKRFIFASLLMVTGLQTVFSQSLKITEEGTGYYLPRTELFFTIQVEKTTYTPGEFSIYADKYLKMRDVNMQSSETYRIIDIKIHSLGERDTSKYYLAPTDAKHNIQDLNLDDNGVLLSINAAPKEIKLPVSFTPAPRPAKLNPRDYMNEDILSAGSTAKMAELSALEIYDIRESKSSLSKGQADFMPKDGEQLRIMLDNLATQERALMQLFTGVTIKDTTETVIKFVPNKPISKQLLFRFSKWMGITDADDLGGEPYYLSVEDLRMTPPIKDLYLNTRKVKDNSGIYVNMPGKIKVSLFKGGDLLSAYELYAAQFGRTEMLTDELFNKRYFTSLILNPVTGNLDQLKTESVKK